jgi:hypothetical protein
LRRPALLALLVAATAAMSATTAGCGSYRYYDVDVSFAGFTGASTTSTIQTCHVYVSGAETSDYYIVDQCPPDATHPSHMGIFEYSSLADSGSLTFEMKAFNGIPEGASCQVGDGSTTVTIGGMNANMTTNMLTLSVAAMGTGCHP